VHPGVGAVMRQWPAEYFASVIDLLVEQNQVNVVLVGGRDEADLAREVLGHIVNRRSVVSLVGVTSLAELNSVLRACVLYLGNNSGPQHIAAALGVPTVGIYSGVVDAAEWGPTGPRAIALQRNMVCGPCYLVKPEDCVRDMACLKRLEPAVVHQYCQMMLARAVPVVGAKAAKVSSGAADRTGRKRVAAGAKATPRTATVVGLAPSAANPAEPLGGKKAGKVGGRRRLVGDVTVKPKAGRGVKLVPSKAKPAGHTGGNAAAKLLKRKATGTERPRRS
jgi:hypothetical protein